MIYHNFKKVLKILSKIRSKVSILIFFCFFIAFFSIIGDFALADDDEILVAEDIYRLAENNGIAHSICKAIEIGTILMVPLFAIMFSILGLAAYQGNIKWSTFVTFALGIAAFKAAGTIAEWFMPEMGLRYGCKCAIERKIRDADGVVKRYATGLNYDCSEGTEDYESEYIDSSSSSDSGKQQEIDNLHQTIELLNTDIANLNSQITSSQAEVDACGIKKENNNTYTILDGGTLKQKQQEIETAGIARSNAIEACHNMTDISDKAQCTGKDPDADHDGYWWDCSKFADFVDNKNTYCNHKLYSYIDSDSEQYNSLCYANWKNYDMYQHSNDNDYYRALTEKYCNYPPIQDDDLCNFYQNLEYKYFRRYSNENEFCDVYKSYLKALCEIYSQKLVDDLPVTLTELTNTLDQLKLKCDNLSTATNDYNTAQSEYDTLYNSCKTSTDTLKIKQDELAQKEQEKAEAEARLNQLTESGSGSSGNQSEVDRLKALVDACGIQKNTDGTYTVLPEGSLATAQQEVTNAETNETTICNEYLSKINEYGCSIVSSSQHTCSDNTKTEEVNNLGSNCTNAKATSYQKRIDSTNLFDTCQSNADDYELAKRG